MFVHIAIRNNHTKWSTLNVTIESFDNDFQPQPVTRGKEGSRQKGLPEYNIWLFISCCMVCLAHITVLYLHKNMPGLLVLISFFATVRCRMETRFCTFE